MRVLVVDDEVSQLQTLAALLNAEGFDVETCSTGREALERLGSGTFGVAVVDLLLPDLSGAELLGELSHCENSPHVILYTAFASYESARDAVNLWRRPPIRVSWFPRCTGLSGRASSSVRANSKTP